MLVLLQAATAVTVTHPVLLHCVPPAILIIAPTAPLVSVLVRIGLQPQVPAALEIVLHLTPVHRAIIMSSQAQPAVAPPTHRVIKLAIPIAITMVIL